jgi:hypothetical protein
MDCSGIDDDINDMLDEALDDSHVTLESGPTPPKVARSMSPGNLTVFYAPEVDFHTESLISRNFSCQNTMYSSRFRHLTIFFL